MSTGTSFGLYSFSSSHIHTDSHTHTHTLSYTYLPVVDPWSSKQDVAFVAGECRRDSLLAVGKALLGPALNQAAFFSTELPVPGGLVQLGYLQVLLQDYTAARHQPRLL